MKRTSEHSEGPPSFQGLKGRALALLTRREHSRAELMEKLRAAGGEDGTISALLDELEALQLQDDGRFAEALVRSRVIKGYGPATISQLLRQKGVAQELIEATLEAVDDWLALAEEVRCRRFGSELPVGQVAQAKQIRFLQYRGFSLSHACRLVQARRGDE